MAHDRLRTDPNDAADLPVGLAARDPDQAIALTVRDDGMRRRAKCPGATHPPRALERERDGELRQRQTMRCERTARRTGEGAGHECLAGHMRRNGEAPAQTGSEDRREKGY